eukprot:s395_g39.t1
MLTFRLSKDGSAIFYAHRSVIEQLLRASGRDSMFLKLHSSSESKFPTHLLWMPQGTDYNAALDFASGPSILGLVVKNTKAIPRYALRFGDPKKLQDFAAAILFRIHLRMPGGASMASPLLALAVRLGSLKARDGRWPSICIWRTANTIVCSRQRNVGPLLHYITSFLDKVFNLSVSKLSTLLARGRNFALLSFS